MAISGTDTLDAWVKDHVGVDPASYGAASASANRPGGGKSGHSPKGKAVSVKPAPAGPLSDAARDPKVWTQSVGPALTRQGSDKVGARIKATTVTGQKTVCKGTGGKEVTVIAGADGRVAITRDPPPISEITFSGGGGKGSALPGAVRALTESGALKGVKTVTGASVGSMTAAMVAAGVTPEDFEKLSNDTKFAPLVQGNEKVMINVEGDGLEELVRGGMGSSISKQIAKFASDAQKSGTKVPPATVDMLTAMTKKFAGGAGPTFGDLRTLSKVIPDIKEVVITGTLIGTSGKPKPGHPPGKIKDMKPQMMVFSADTQPDMEVARAVHASAALPPVFKPVDIPLASGEVGRFEDGGVLNNAPSSDTLGTERAVDPVPPSGKMTFVFDDDTAQEIVKGKAKPSRNPVNDMISGAENSAADFGKNRNLADRPEDVVIVPLKFDRMLKPKPAKEHGKDRGLLQRAKDAVGDAADQVKDTADAVKDAVNHPKEFIFAKKDKADFSGTVMGTLNFDIALDDKLKLQSMTKDATKTHLEKRQEKETRSFASMEQMFCCTTRDDLQAMADSKLAGAKEALKFRDDVVKQVAALEKLAASGPAVSPKIYDGLTAINKLAGGSQERLAFIGREMNRSGKLDGVLKAYQTGGGQAIDAVAAGLAVEEVLESKKAAQKILRSTVYPKMVREGPDGAMGALLATMDQELRDARSRADINHALRPAIAYFSKRFDAGGILGHQDFADALTKQLQPE